MSSQSASVGRDLKGNLVQNQYNGEQTFSSLTPGELIQEEVLAKTVIRSERIHRFRWSGISALIGLVLIAVGYIFFLNRGDLTLADVLNGLSPAILSAILPFLIPWGLALGSLLVSYIKFQMSPVERENLARLPAIENMILSKGVSRKELKKLRKAANTPG